jgi:GDP-4-dehydro-6-deoxy-D-mannose reductase
VLAAPPRILITGANGFVGRHLLPQLRCQFGDDVALCPTSLHGCDEPSLGLVQPLDVTDAAASTAIVAAFKPTHVIHLAGLAAVTGANENTNLAWNVHLFGALNVARGIMQHDPGCVMLSVGSGQIYGATARSGAALDEDAVLAPTNGYEATKAAADLALGALVTQGLKVIRLRPFNHTGPGQTLDFAIPSFAMQIARIEVDLQEPVVKVGNLDAERDFLDVRDVARAYGMAVAKSGDIPAGTILNIASGKPRRMRDLLDQLLAMSRVPIAVALDPARMRPSDTPRYLGSAKLAERLLGWTPSYTIETTLADVLDDCRRRVAV